MAAPPEQIAFLKAQAGVMLEQSNFLKAQVKGNEAQHKAMETMHVTLARTTDHVQALTLGFQAFVTAHPHPAVVAPPAIDHMLEQLTLASHHSFTGIDVKLGTRACILEPCLWLRLIQLRQPALTSDDLQDSDEMPGRVLQAFSRAIVQHFPLSSENDRRELDESFVQLGRVYLSAKAHVSTPPTAGQWENAAKAIMRDTKVVIARTRRLLVRLEADTIRSVHGDASARMFTIAETEHGQHNMSAMTYKQVIYASTVTKRVSDRNGGGGGGAGGGGGGSVADRTPGMAVCRWCKEEVTPGSFVAHNKVCKSPKKPKKIK